MKVEICKQKSLDFETQPFPMKVFRWLLMPLLNLLPHRLGLAVFTSFGTDTKEIYTHATSFKALEVLYTRFERPFFKSRVLDGCADYIWHYLSANAMAVRNRLKLTKRELKEAILSISQRKDKVNILSLGSGSARAIIETLSELSNASFTIQVKLLDISKNALNYSKDLAGEYNISENIEWIRGNIQHMERYLKNFVPDIIEMVGILDYFNNDRAIDVISKIHRVLAPWGILITCNIKDNFERPFVTKSIGWSLIYRSKEELEHILAQGGFLSNQCLILLEPFQIHQLVVCPAEKFNELLGQE